MKRFALVLYVFLLLRCCKPRPLFLVPILWNGPNNQITTIKETISLTKLLPGSQAVIPNLRQHKFTDGVMSRMQIPELFDIAALDKGNVSFLLLESFREQWNGHLDAVLYLREARFPLVGAMANNMNLTAPEPEHWIRSNIGSVQGCSAAQVDVLRKTLAPYKYVGILSFNDFAPQTQKLAGTLLLDCEDDLCCEAYKRHSSKFKKSQWVNQMAEDYVRKTFGSDGGRFVASHIRPMPDSCVSLWTSPEGDLDPSEMSVICRNNYLYDRFVPNLLYLKNHYNATHVFVMTHPFIRARVSTMLESAGIRPAFLDLDHLNASISAAASPLRTPLSFSLLAMVEEAVAAAATAFLGTAESSMTGMIVQERLARGIPADTNHFMSRRVNCLEAPCRLEDYYVLRAGMPQIPPGAQPRRVGPLKDFASWQREAPK